MSSYYEVLRIKPETDIQAKSEADIVKKIENNYKALIARAPQMYPAESVRMQMLKELDEARAVLIDPIKRAEYAVELQQQNEKKREEQVSIDVFLINDEIIAEINAQIEAEGDNDQESGAENN